VVTGAAGAGASATSIATVTPADGQTVKARIRWEARASGDAPRKVEFLVDGNLVWTERNEPFVFGGNDARFDTRTFRDGRHVLSVRATGGDGSVVSSAVAVTFANGTAAAPRPSRRSAPRAKPGLVYVDAGSRGGTCRDARTVAQAKSARTPWCSLQRAATAAPSGSTVVVRGGSYAELQIENVHRRPHVTFRPFLSEQVAVAGIGTKNTSGLRFQGLRITSYVDLGDYSDRIQLIGNDLSPHGIHMRRVNGVLIERNRIHDLAPKSSNGKCGCGIWGQSWKNENGVRNVVIRRNVITDLHGDGIHFGNGRNVVIEGNTITNAIRIDDDHVDSIQIMGTHGLVIRGNYIGNNQHGLMFTDKASPGVVIENNVIVKTSYGINAGDIPDARIVNNTFWGNRWGAALIRDDARDAPQPDGIVFKNNIIDETRHSDGGRFAEYGYNLVETGPLLAPTDRRGTARFVNPERGNFRLAAGSPGIDAGTSVRAPQRDRAGRPRRDDRTVRNRGGGSPNYYDIGAHER